MGGQIRIVGVAYEAKGQIEGQLQIAYNGEWGAVCDDVYNSNLARVACREMGYLGGYQSSSGIFGISSTSSVFLDKVLCTGSEAHIIECQHNPWLDHNCGNHQIVNIRCNNCNPY